MSRDPRAVAEARALLACIRVTEDPVEQNRLWNRYYRLSDKVFPEAAALRTRYKSLKGEERQRFKHEYMVLVGRLWAATDPEAAFEGLLEPQAVNRTPVQRSRKRAPGHRWALAVVLSAVAGVGLSAWWHYAGQQTLPSGSPTEQAVAVVAPEPEAPAVPVAEIPSFPEAELSPAPETEVPIADIEAALAREILPVFSPVDPALKGRGDRLAHGGRRFEDVYLIETDALYYVRIPERGAVESVAKEGTEATFSTDTAGREALLALWKQNREEIDRVAAVREQEKAVRIAAYREVLDEAAEAHKQAQEAAWWQSKGREWASLAPDQRHGARVRAYSNWKAIQDDAETVRELYTNISRAYQLVGISDSRMGRLNAAYAEAQKALGPDFEVEDALIMYGWGRDELIRHVSEWEQEYYRLLAYVEEQYPAHEARVEEIKRLDTYLPEAIRLAESAPDWDSGPGSEIEGGSTGVGTGFVVAKGYIMTCAHVVRGGSKVTVTSTAGKLYPASIVTMDAANDWALLRVEGLESDAIPMAPDKPNVGATIYCMGYPLGGIKDSADPIVGSGNIAALQRLDGDSRFLQITAPVNPGNSGGPVLDQYGRWVGVVSQKLNDLDTLQTSQIVTQGVNYAVKATVIKPLLDPRSSVELAKLDKVSGAPLSLEAIAKQATPAIVRIEVK